MSGADTPTPRDQIANVITDDYRLCSVIHRDDVGAVTDAILALPFITEMQARIAEYDAACESQGLPIGTHISRFVMHHRGNAGMTVAAEGVAKRFRLEARIAELEAAIAATERAVKIAAAVDAEVEWCRRAGWGADEWNNGIDAHNDLLARLRAAGES